MRNSFTSSVKKKKKPPWVCRTDSVVARNNSILKQLVLQAKKEYEAEAVHRIQIYFADSYGSWRYTDSRHKRPLSSIVLNPGVKEMLVADAKDFLKSEKVGRAPFLSPCFRLLLLLFFFYPSADISCFFFFSFRTVVRRPRHSLPSWVLAIRRPGLGQVVAHPRARRRAHARHLRRLFVVLVDK
jgi:hypothetical protein